MIFTPCDLRGAYLIDPEPHEDDRGSFARIWCRNEFREHGLDDRLVQCNTSWNRKAGTLRGMHYQLPPAAETKMVKCIRGAIFDVIADLRPHSPTFLRWYGAELRAESGRMLYIPMGFAHGFRTLTDDTEILYFMSDFFAPELSRGLRWSDPQLAIDWPGPPAVISARDNAYPDLVKADLNAFASLPL